MGQLLYSNENITRNEIDLLPVPQALGRFHHPYSFGQYIDDIENALDLNGLVIANQEFELAGEGQRLFGALEVQAKDGELITADDWKLLVGLRGSHDQSVQRGLALGSQVLVCSNLCFSGSIGTVNTKQTTNIESRIPALLRQSLDLVPELAYQQERTFDAYKEFEVKPRIGDAFLVEAHRRGALSAAQLGRAIHEWDQPAYEEHAQYDAGTGTRSAWRLLNASTEALKPTGSQHNPVLVQQRSEIVSSFLDEVVGL